MPSRASLFLFFWNIFLRLPSPPFFFFVCVCWRVGLSAFGPRRGSCVLIRNHAKWVGRRR
ncbi:MAG: hypothetical protein ACKERG_04725 [Candidatus Hodgkinia cicadicola]